jgi:hypothetical protein
MLEDEKDNKSHSLTRRDFAIGSVAVLGASLAGAAESPPPLSEEAQAMKLLITDSVRDLLDIRHILDEDIKRVIDNAEKTQKKLCQPGTNNFLSKLRVKEVYFYVEYSPSEEGHRIHTAYSHRFLIDGESNNG